ncbi:MAG: peptidoglycan binding protein CsiV [Gammaproteobacteria bacterium]|nr:peptidoglycan binding protein CsiV [Gammaproteobacteria bacterium]
MKLFVYLYTALLVFTPFVTVAAEEKSKLKPDADPVQWYQVEMIIFQPPQPVVESSEQWDGWSKKRAPINYEESVEISYPVTPESNNSTLDATTDLKQPPENSGVISLKQAEIIVAESLNKASQQQTAIEQSPQLQPFTFTANSEWTLTEVYQRLNRSDQYKLLIHTAWLQPGLSREEALAVHIDDHMMLVDETDGSLIEERVIDELNSDSNNEGFTAELTDDSISTIGASTTAATAYPLESSLFEQSYGADPGGTNQPLIAEPEEITFNGTVKVILTRYLHFEINMDYAPSGFPGEPGNSNGEMGDKTAMGALLSNSTLSTINSNGRSAEPELYKTTALDNLLSEGEGREQPVYRLQDSRRMRSRELHYIDHPKIGVLVNIVPVETPKIDAESVSGDS